MRIKGIGFIDDASLRKRLEFPWYSSWDIEEDFCPSPYAAVKN